MQGKQAKRNGYVEFFKRLMDDVGTAIDGMGVCIIVLGALWATGRFFHRLRAVNAYFTFRQNLGWAILLGLEFLVAGDIIRTVAVSPTLSNVIILGLIVLIRTFLSMALQREIGGLKSE